MKFLRDTKLPTVLTTKHSQDLTLATSKRFGLLHEVCVTDRGIRVLVSESGMSFWFPEAVWKSFNAQVRCYLSAPLCRDCWIARKGWALGKLDIDVRLMEPDLLKRYFNSDRTTVSMARALDFLRRNFVNNPRAYTTSKTVFRMTY